MKVHHLKTLEPYFEQQCAGTKQFELRRLDRDFALGDELVLEEITDGGGAGEGRRTGRTHRVRITCILEGFAGLEPGYGVLGTEPAGSTGQLKRSSPLR